MARFDVFENRAQYPPLLCQIQSQFHDHLHTRVVIPLFSSEDMRGECQHQLTPEVEIAGQHYLLLTQQMTTVLTSQIGKKVDSLSQMDYKITAAIDFLMQGF